MEKMAERRKKIRWGIAEAEDTGSAWTLDSISAHCLGSPRLISSISNFCVDNRLFTSQLSPLTMMLSTNCLRAF